LSLTSALASVDPESSGSSTEATPSAAKAASLPLPGKTSTGTCTEGKLASVQRRRGHVFT
jgi:hypothetical protein